MRFLDALNTPRAVVLALFVILAVNGFLFYQQRGSSSSANSQTTPGLTTRSEATQKKSSPQAALPKATTSPTTGRANPKEKTSQQANREKTAAERTNRKETTQERAGGDRTDQKPTTGERPKTEQTSRAGQAGGKEPQKQVSPAGGKSLADLGGAVGRCRASGDGCIRDFVLGVYPTARYIGGRTDLATGRGNSDTRVLYFETPKMKTCQYRRENYRSQSGPGYTVIVVGEGSFDAKRGNGCIPTA